MLCLNKVLVEAQECFARVRNNKSQPKFSQKLGNLAV